MSSRFRVLIVALTLVALLPLAGCTTETSRGEEATPTPIPPPPVPERPTYTVKRGEVVDSLNFTGRVSPSVEQGFYFRTSGRVRKVYVERNEVVKEGTLLAELENDDLVRQLQQADLELEATTLNLRSAEESRQYAIGRAQIALQMQRLQLAKAEAATNNSLDLTIAAASIQRAEAAVKLAQSRYDIRAQTGGHEGSPEALALEQATLDYQIAQANYNRTAQAQELARYDLDILRQQVALAQLELEHLSREVDPQLTKAVERAELSVERLTAFVDETRITSPISGRVASVSLKEGDPVEAFKTVFVISDDQELMVRADPLSSQLQKLGEGMEVSITLQAYPGKTLHGQITQLPYPYGSGGGSSQSEDADKNTHIAFNPEDLDLKSGDLVRVVVTLEKKDDTLYLPPAAVRTFSGRKFVVIEEGGRQSRVDVTVGIESEERVEILDGVEEGQVVVGQ